MVVPTFVRTVKHIYILIRNPISSLTNRILNFLYHHPPSPPQPVVIEGKEELKVEKIMNKRQVRGRDKYLVRWKGCTVEEDTWESKDNLKNTSNLVEEFEKEYRRTEEEEARQ